MKQALSFAVLALISTTLNTLSGQTFQVPVPSCWYRIVTRYNGNDARSGRCIQYCDEQSEHPGLLWSAAPVSSGMEENYQLWSIIPSPKNPARFKLVCKAAPEGFVNPTPTSTGPDARWEYVASADGSSVDPYGFILLTDHNLSGVDNGVSYCGIASDATINNYYCLMNCGASRQGYAINLWNDDYSEDANEWKFEEIPGITTGISIIFPETENETPVWYDLCGRVVREPTKGIYIRRGKKIILF